VSADDERAERELEDWLRRLPPGAHGSPDAEKRAAARQAFLAAGATGAVRAGGAGAAPEPRSRTGFRPRTVLVDDAEGSDGFAAWLAECAPAAPPAPEVRRRARLAFLSALAGERPLLRTRRSFRALVLTLAAAAIVAVTFLLPAAEHWEVELGGPLRFAAAEYAPGEDGRLAAALEGSGTVETGGERARFTLGGVLDVELLAGSALSFPPLPELDGVEPIAFELTRGEAYVRTRADYPGNPVIVRTGLADVVLSGTTIGVLVDGDCTCVCVAEGRVRVTGARLPGAGQELGPRASLRLFEDASLEPRIEAFPPEAEGAGGHVQELVDFVDAP
jgi:FecR-like protein